MANAVADAPTEESVSTGSTKQAKSPSVQVNMPAELKGMVEEAAKAQDISTSSWMAKLAAREFNYDIPVTVRTRQKQYATEEERKAAAAARQRSKNEAVLKLIEAAKAGDIANLSPEVKALLGI